MPTCGRYQVLEEIGQGESSVVYKGLDPVLNRTVAIKVYTGELALADGEAGDWREQFRRDLEAAGRLDHPNIVRVFDAGFDGDRHYTVMEYVEGTTLQDAILGERLALGDKLHIARQIGRALAAAHAQGVVHHDLRPSNILLTRDGVVKIADFGFARLASPASDPTPVPGPLRVHYRAPEQIYGKKADERTDVFSFGIVLYELLLRRKPFDGETWIQVTEKILNLDPPHLKEASGEFPDALTRVLARALAKNPLDRYQSLTELNRDLQVISMVVTPSDTSGSPPLPLPPRPAAAPAAPPEQAFLLVEEGDRRQAVPLSVDEFTIGRRADNHLTLKDEHISRAHACVKREQGRYLLVDLGSKHGTYLNGERVENAPLRDGDRIDLGKGRRFRLAFRTGAPEAETTGSHPLGASSGEQRMGLLLDVSRALNSLLSVDGVLHLIMDSALAFTGAERGFIMLREADGSFVTRVSRYMNPRAPAALNESVSTGVVERCLASGKPVVIHNIDEHSDLAQRDSVLAMSLKSVLCVPLLFRGEVRGVLYLDSRQLKAPFRSGQLDLLLAFAAHAAIALENARLYEVAIVDQPTGLYLKHYFSLRLSEEFQRAVRHQSPLALVFIDIDHFKKVNDTHGHMVGDAVLRDIAQVLKAQARNTDIAARYGGEEFVLLAPETPLEYAATVAERLRAAVAAEPMRAGGAVLDLTISLGVAAYPHLRISRPEELVAEADGALLQAKNRGRNQVCVVGGETPAP